MGGSIATLRSCYKDYTEYTTSNFKMTSKRDTEAELATAVPAEPTSWDEDTVKNLGITFAPVADNTSDFTRTELRDKIPQRYFDVKMTFNWDGQESQYLKVDDAIIPYVAPPKPQAGRKSGPNKYGSNYVYASLPRVLLDHIINEAAVHGYNVIAGEPRMPSTEDDWWMTLNLNKHARVKMERKKGEGHTDASLSRIFLASKLGVTSNVVLSLKLKCSLQEEVKDDGSYYGHDEGSPVQPDDNTQWAIGSTMPAMFISDIGVDVPPPTRVQRSINDVPKNFTTTDADAGSDELTSKLKAFGI